MNNGNKDSSCLHWKRLLPEKYPTKVPNWQANNEPKRVHFSYVRIGEFVRTQTVDIERQIGKNKAKNNKNAIIDFSYFVFVSLLNI